MSHLNFIQIVMEKLKEEKISDEPAGIGNFHSHGASEEIILNSHFSLAGHAQRWWDCYLLSYGPCVPKT